MNESPTEQGSENTGSAQADLPENQSNPSADEHKQDSVSSEQQDADQSDNQQSEDSSTDEDSSSNDDGLAKFAKSQGFDPDNLTDGERKALKLAHDNQKAYRQTNQKKTDELVNTVKDVNTPSQEELDDLEPSDARLAQIEAEQRILKQELRTERFFKDNPEADEFKDEMGKVILEEIEKYSNPEEGRAAGRFLASDLNRLLVLAQARRGNSSEDARRQGAREERENLRKKQEGSADNMQATQTNKRGSKITREDIENMSDEDYIQLRDSGELQAAISRGDLY